MEAFIYHVFGSCGGVVDAASCLFRPSNTNNASCMNLYQYPRQHKTPKPYPRKQTQPPSPIRRSNEVIEIPEFLSPSVSSRRYAVEDEYVGQDDISAISAATLEEMARRGLRENAPPLKYIIPKEIEEPVPPSPARTVASDSSSESTGYHKRTRYDVPNSGSKDEVRTKSTSCSSGSSPRSRNSRPWTLQR